MNSRGCRAAIPPERTAIRPNPGGVLPSDGLRLDAASLPPEDVKVTTAAYPWLTDDDFVAAHLGEWLE